MNNRGGFVLVIVLVAVALLVSLVTVFISEVYLETGSTSAGIDTAQGSLFAEGGITGARQLIGFELGNRSYSTLNDTWARPLVIDDPQGQGQLRISIEEESSKLNLNAIALPNGSYNQAYFDMAQRLFSQLKLQLEPLEAIADWIDEGDTPNPGGSEADWYRAQKQPYQPRNKPLLTLDEIKKIKGVAELFSTISPYVTVYGDQPGGTFSAQVNINTAPKQVLMALDERISASLAERIIQYRTETPFKTPAELGLVPGMEQISTGLLTRISAKGTVFRIRADGVVKNATRSIEAVVRLNGATTSIIYWREY